MFWARDLARLMQLSFVGYLVGGLVINHAFFEYFYVQISIVAALHIIVSKTVTVPSPELSGIIARNTNSRKTA